MVLAVNKSKCLSPVNHTTKTIHHHHLILSGFSFPQLLHRLLSNFQSFLLPELLHYEVFLIFIFFSFSLTRMKLLRCFFIVSQISCYQNQFFCGLSFYRDFCRSQLMPQKMIYIFEIKHTQKTTASFKLFTYSSFEDMLACVLIYLSLLSIIH